MDFTCPCVMKSVEVSVVFVVIFLSWPHASPRPNSARSRLLRLRCGALVGWWAQAPGGSGAVSRVDSMTCLMKSVKRLSERSS